MPSFASQYRESAIGFLVLLHWVITSMFQLFVLDFHQVNVTLMIAVIKTLDSLAHLLGLRSSLFLSLPRTAFLVPLLLERVTR